MPAPEGQSTVASGSAIVQHIASRDATEVTTKMHAQSTFAGLEPAAEAPETFRVSRSGRAPLLEFIEGGLRDTGCALIQSSPADEAPFRISFVTPWGERMGIIAYAFTANARPTRNRPSDEHRFQVKYGTKDGRLHTLWQDPFGLYTTLFLGINVEGGFFVGADPVLNSPTRFFISKEFKQAHVDEIQAHGWNAWEREQRREYIGDPVEVLVGGTREHLLRYTLFEREVRGEDQGHRQLVADRFASAHRVGGGRVSEAAYLAPPASPTIVPARLHELEREFELGSKEILELIAGAPRLKMAVRGWVAERHLEAKLGRLPEVTDVETIEADGQPDFRVRVRGGRRPLLIECKNVLRTRNRHGYARLDFMRTRASPTDPCSRYYRSDDFDVLAACLHASTERWEFAARRTADMSAHRRCPGRLEQRVIIDDAWERDISAVLARAAASAT